MKYIEERNKKSFELLEKAKTELPGFCSRFFLGISQTTQPLSRLNYAYDLKLFFKYLSTETDTFNGKKPSDYILEDLNKVEVFHIEMFANELKQNNGERGVMRKLSCLRSFFSYFFKQGEIEKNILPNIDLPKLHDKNIIRLDTEEIAKIIGGAKEGTGLTPGQMRFHGKTGFRDMVILTFFLSTGIRVSELVGLNVGDIDLKSSSFKITRKGGNETILYMTSELQTVLNEYLSKTNFPASAPLFISLNGGRLCVRAVEKLVKKYAVIASPLKKISPHKLRSTFGTNLYRATGDIYVVADVLGHQNVNTTRKHYAELTEDVKKDAMIRFESAKKI